MSIRDIVSASAEFERRTETLVEAERAQADHRKRP